MGEPETGWLLLRHGFYERAAHAGYTGLRDEAGRYDHADAVSAVTHGRPDTSMAHETEALEFRPQADTTLVIRHLLASRDTLTESLRLATERAEAAERAQAASHDLFISAVRQREEANEYGDAEHARAEAAERERSFSDGCFHSACAQRDEALTRARGAERERDEARAKALDEAAHLAEGPMQAWGEYPGGTLERDKIAVAIRALAAEEQKG